MDMTDQYQDPLIPPPHIALALTEAHRAAGEIAALLACRRWLARMPQGDGHGVVVLPGFLGDDGYNAPLRRYLNKLGYHCRGWEQGRNLGPRVGVLDDVLEHLARVCDETGDKITLVGHSLGGIYARELAKQMPEQIRQVISLGSPFGRGRDTASYPRRLFSILNPDEQVTIAQHVLHEPPEVPTTAVYSKGDGVVNWRTACQLGDYTNMQNIEVWGSHCGMTMNPTIWFLLAERLQQTAENWQPFQRSSWKGLFNGKTD
jgi:pimeloyl-ACP methyl ester carboxylesterase